VSLADWVLGRLVRLPEAEQARLQRWRELPEPDTAQSHGKQRFVVVDVESSGLDVHNDRLIAIGAVAVDVSRIALADCFYAVLRQSVASEDDNILVHGIGGTSQIEGEEPRLALLDFLEFAGKAPLIAYHAPFDEVMLRRAMRRILGESFARTWLDLAWLAPALDPDRAKSLRGLDEWARAFGIPNHRRHHALADALATAQLHLALQNLADARGLQRTRDLLETARSQAWIARGGQA